MAEISISIEIKYFGGDNNIIATFNIIPKVIYPKYSKHWLYNVAHTIDCLCSKMLNHGLNHGLFLSLFKLPHTLNCICVYLNFKFEF